MNVYSMVLRKQDGSYAYAWPEANNKWAALAQIMGLYENATVVSIHVKRRAKQRSLKRRKAGQWSRERVVAPAAPRLRPAPD